MRIELVDYDPTWPHAFETAAAEIRAALGTRALCIEHVGSTSVPELPAKPLIDIVLAVADSAHEDDYAPALASAGYHVQIREPGWYEHRMLTGANRRVNLHVFSDGCPGDRPHARLPRLAAQMPRRPCVIRPNEA